MIRTIAYPILLERAPEVMEFLRPWDLDTVAQVIIKEQLVVNSGNF